MMNRPEPWIEEERRQTAMEDMPHIYCDVCGAALYSGDQYYDIGGEVWCPDCIERELKRTVDFD